jgi:hypothetical protein
MDKTYHCNCKTGCETGRCTCLRNGEPCDEGCGCVECANPLNGVDVERLSACAIQNIEAFKALSAQDLETPYELPCGHASVPLRELLGAHYCQGCGESYWYSFCWEDVVSEGHTWHCRVCRTCRDWREWHCEKCNHCTYGISLPCEYCGNRHKRADMFR